VDPIGDDSFIVARGLYGGWVPGVGHAFVVTNAKYYGDPNADVFSFGLLKKGKLGNISKATRAARAGATVNRDDYAAWVTMGTRGTPFNVSRINAPDVVVEAVANAIIEDIPYSPKPNSQVRQIFVKDIGYVSLQIQGNSTTGAFAVGDTAEQIASGDPQETVDRSPFILWLPGEESAKNVRFDWSTFDDRITGSRCTGRLDPNCPAQ
jgi:hypothetical protein